MRFRKIAALCAAFSAAGLLALPSASQAAENGCPKDRPAGHDCRNPKTVTLSGTAYTFNTRNVIAGATIAIDELPGISTTTAADGSWSLKVPWKSDLTPYITAAGHHTTYGQTFHVRHDAVANINFQTPTLQTAAALRGLITSYIGRDPFQDGCVIVSTVSDPRVVNMTFDEFIHFAPHGVAGATASSTPALPQTLYFNDSVLPDPSLTHTSGDGGVLWPNVPAGTYEISATHPTVKFAPFTATCTDHRLINTGPPQGLHGIPN
jgi:hypothetical protein